MSTNTITDVNNSITFINLYSNDNPILEIGDDCYFVYFNSIDYHIPLIASGKVIYDRFNDTINKHYFISIQEILDPKHIYDKFIYDKQVQLYPFNHTTLNISTKPKVYRFNDKFETKFFEENLIKIECFFVRKTLEEIKSLQKDFATIIRNDTMKQVSELQEILAHE